MNILVDSFPTSLEIDGVDYEIKTDYRYSLYTILAFEDKELTNYEKLNIMLENLFVEIPDNVEAMLEKTQWFLNGGKESSSDDSENRLYSFSKDASLIFAAFKQTHNIDLEQETNLHWWKFLSYFMDLGQNTVFCQLVALRDKYYSGRASKEEKQAIRKMGDMFYIDQTDDTLSLEDREKVERVKEDYRKAKELRGK